MWEKKEKIKKIKETGGKGTGGKKEVKNELKNFACLKFSKGKRIQLKNLWGGRGERNQTLVRIYSPEINN